MSRKDDKAWFAPKRYGYGAGLPVAWQGWALLAGYIVVMLGCVLLVEWDAEIGLPVAVVVGLLATLLLGWVAAARTRGGWRWRWGGDR